MPQPDDLLKWLTANESQLIMLYPNQYVLITIPKGVIAFGDTVEQLYHKINKLQEEGASFSEEELKQPCYLIFATNNSPLGDRSKWGQA